MELVPADFKEIQKISRSPSTQNIELTILSKPVCCRQTSDKLVLPAAANLQELAAARLRFSPIVTKVDSGHTRARDRKKNSSKPAAFKRELWGHTV